MTSTPGGGGGSKSGSAKRGGGGGGDASAVVEDRKSTIPENFRRTPERDVEKLINEGRIIPSDRISIPDGAAAAKRLDDVFKKRGDLVTEFQRRGKTAKQSPYENGVIWRAISPSFNQAITGQNKMSHFEDISSHYGTVTKRTHGRQSSDLKKSIEAQLSIMVKGMSAKEQATALKMLENKNPGLRKKLFDIN